MGSKRWLNSLRFSGCRLCVDLRGLTQLYDVWLPCRDLGPDCMWSWGTLPFYLAFLYSFQPILEDLLLLLEFLSEQMEFSSMQIHSQPGECPQNHRFLSVTPSPHLTVLLGSFLLLSLTSSPRPSHLLFFELAFTEVVGGKVSLIKLLCAGARDQQVCLLSLYSFSILELIGSLIIACR